MDHSPLRRRYEDCAEVIQSLRADLIAIDGRLPIQIAGRIIFAQRAQAVVLFRLAQLAYRLRLPILPIAIKWINGVITGSDISFKARVGGGLKLHHPAGVVIGPDTVIGESCLVLQGVTLGAGRGGSPLVGRGVVLLPGCVVVGKVRIGDRSVIGANSVVTKDVGVNEMWAGNPARYLREADWVV